MSSHKNFIDNPLIFNFSKFLINIIVVDIDGKEKLIKTNKYHNIFYLKKKFVTENNSLSNIHIYDLKSGIISDYKMLSSLENNIVFININYC